MLKILAILLFLCPPLQSRFVGNRNYQESVTNTETAARRSHLVLIKSSTFKPWQNRKLPTQIAL